MSRADFHGEKIAIKSGEMEALVREKAKKETQIRYDSCQTGGRVKIKAQNQFLLVFGGRALSNSRLVEIE